jgi:hypothetical protein
LRQSHLLGEGKKNTSCEAVSRQQRLGQMRRL